LGILPYQKSTTFGKPRGYPTPGVLKRKSGKDEEANDCKVAKNATEYKYAVKSSFRIAGLKLDGG
jgi:hypothetical protein